MEVQDDTALLLGWVRVRVQQSGGDVWRLEQGPRGWVWRMIAWSVVGPSRWLLAVGEVALRRRKVTVVLILVNRRGAMVGGVVGVHMMVVVAVISVVMMVTVVAVMVVSNQTISSIPLPSHGGTAAVA